MATTYITSPVMTLVQRSYESTANMSERLMNIYDLEYDMIKSRFWVEHRAHFYIFHENLIKPHSFHFYCLLFSLLFNLVPHCKSRSFTAAVTPFLDTLIKFYHVLSYRGQKWLLWAWHGVAQQPLRGMNLAELPDNNCTTPTPTGCCST